MVWMVSNPCLLVFGCLVVFGFSSSISVFFRLYGLFFLGLVVSHIASARLSPVLMVDVYIWICDFGLLFQFSLEWLS